MTRLALAILISSLTLTAAAADSWKDQATAKKLAGAALNSFTTSQAEPSAEPTEPPSPAQSAEPPSPAQSAEPPSPAQSAEPPSPAPSAKPAGCSAVRTPCSGQGERGGCPPGCSCMGINERECQ
jgi:hypothetical protein